MHVCRFWVSHIDNCDSRQPDLCIPPISATRMAALECKAVILFDARSIGIVFDEGEVEETVVIDSIKPGSAAKKFPLLKPGMLCKEVRGQSTENMDFDTIIERITVSIYSLLYTCTCTLLRLGVGMIICMHHRRIQNAL
eukprot:COSAG01_NODE_1445_length_10281_cov_33.445099_16_plen_139_part_00